jgi:hypothetical protein
VPEHDVRSRTLLCCGDHAGSIPDSFASSSRAVTPLIRTRLLREF